MGGATGFGFEAMETTWGTRAGFEIDTSRPAVANGWCSY